MDAKYCCNCGAKDGETEKAKEWRMGAVDWQQMTDMRFDVRRTQYDYLCQLCSLLREHRHYYDETTGESKTQV